MVMEEKWVSCDYCKTQVRHKMGEVDCYFKGGPKEEECPYKKLPELESSQTTIPDSVAETPFELVSKQKTIPYSRPDKLSEEPVSYSKSPFEPISEQKTIPYSSPDKPLEEVAFYQEATHSLPPLHVREPSSPPNPFLPPTPQPPASPPPPEPVVKPRKRRGVRIFLSAVIVALLVGSGVLAYYAFRWHSQILSQNSKISTQAAIIQNQSTAIQQAQRALTETIQTAIKEEQATQTALGGQLNNLQATSTAVATNAQLGAFFVSQSQFPTITVTQSPLLSFTLMNSGTLPWSKASGFAFQCTSHTRKGPLPDPTWTPVCPNPGTINIDNPPNVPSGKQCTFSFKFSPSALSLSGGGNVYVTFWQLNYKGTLFGPEVYMKITVN